MNRRGLLMLLLAGATGAAPAATFELDQLMAALARQPGGTARFVETRTSALLDRPLRLSGELIYAPPDRLEKRTLAPRAETIILDKDELSIEGNHRYMTFNVASRPEALAFVASVRSTLAGNRRELEKHFQLALSGTRDAWSLVLAPRAPAVQALVTRITVSGRGGQVRHIEYQQADGDRSDLAIEPTGP